MGKAWRSHSEKIQPLQRLNFYPELGKKCQFENKFTTNDNPVTLGTQPLLGVLTDWRTLSRELIPAQEWKPKAESF